METSYSPFILKWESEPKQCLQSPSLSHLSPSLTLSGCRWESRQLLFFISKRSIDALLAPVCSFSIFRCSLERRVAVQAVSRAGETWPKLGLPCSDLQMAQERCSTPWRGSLNTGNLVWKCSHGAPRAGGSAAWRLGTAFVSHTNNKGLSSRILLECLWLMQNEKIRCF